MITHDEAVVRARRLAASQHRVLLGIAGKPGAGKSTLAEAVVAELGPHLARLVPMDGFHLAQSALDALGLSQRKGAPDTFDDAGYAALLTRLRAQPEPVVWAPTFRREIEEPIAGAVAVPRHVPLVVTEGNYLLHWPHVRRLLDDCWWVECDDGSRRARLAARHEAFGKSPAEAQRWATESDEHNAALVAEGRYHADWVIFR